MQNNKGIILWFTGLPAAGKTTVASRVYQRLKKNGANVHLLDGDVVRKMHPRPLGFSREERISHLREVGNTALKLKEAGGLCIVAIIAPYREDRDVVFQRIGAVEIFVDAKLEVCIARDPKGLYARALKGEILNFTGISDPYDPPLTPVIHLHTDTESPEESTRRVLKYLLDRGWIDTIEGSEGVS
jgi:adenylyl-sulfate kinase